MGAMHLNACVLSSITEMFSMAMFFVDDANKQCDVMMVSMGNTMIMSTRGNVILCSTDGFC